MKCVDSFVLGVAFGVLLGCMVAMMFTKPRMCEVVSGDLNHTHVRYGVVVDGDI